MSPAKRKVANTKRINRSRRNGTGTAVTISKFSKSFGDVRAVSNVSFTVKEGEIFAFLGPNGSGKTTTIRCLLGIYPAEKGVLHIWGKPYTPEQSATIGYLPEERGLYMGIKALEALVYMGALKGMPQRKAFERGTSLLRELGIEQKANVKISKLSGGEQQKLELAVAIMHKPRLLILDEPTSRLDPVNRELFLSMLLELRRSGTTILFSSHILEDVERVADRLLVLKNGKQVLYGTVREVREQFGTNTLIIEYQGKLSEETERYRARIKGRVAEITPLGKATIHDILLDILHQSVNIDRMERNVPSLRNVYLNVMEKK